VFSISSVPSFTENDGYFSVFPLIAASSLATPMMLVQCPRFGVRDMSRTVSERYSARSVPSGMSLGSSMMPSPSSDSCNSLPEHSIPQDSTPRSLDFFILKVVPSASWIEAPVLAKATFSPLRQLVAPHTTCVDSVPSETVGMQSLSALG